MKILSPAGNMDCLKVAVYNGANEVYLGVNDFNARNNIDGFDMNSLAEAVNFAHLYGVKVNLAINILFTDIELQNALDIIVDAYNMGVDSFIVQDLGLIEQVSKYYPQIELHASTQMGIHNLEGVKFLEQFGIKRVVLARETSLEEIKRIKKNSSVELEYFAHGALCVGFSGNCYLSSRLFNASGNRGRCKQLCRLPYTLKNGGKVLKKGYFLSAKDFNMIYRLKDLKSAGIDVIKIEGRARRPFYVATATKEYYKAINGEDFNPEKLKLAFNRNFTEGYFNGNSNIISENQNHIGVEIGKVINVNYGKKFNEIFFNTNRKVYPQSTFKIFKNNQEICTVSAYDLTFKNGMYKFTTTKSIEKDSLIRLIVDSNEEKQVLLDKFKLEVDIKIIVKVNEPIKAVYVYNGYEHIVLGDVLNLARSSPITKEDLLKTFNKSEFFTANLEIEEFDSVFLSKAQLNEFRRNVYDVIYNVLIKNNRELLPKTKLVINYNVKELKDYIITCDTTLTLKAKNIIYSPEIYNEDEIVNYNSLCKQSGIKFYLDLPNFATEQDIILLKNIVENHKISTVSNNYYSLCFNTETIIGAGLNVYNSYTAQYYDRPVIYAEPPYTDSDNIAHITLRHCPIKQHVGGDCNNCKYNGNYQYVLDSGVVLKLRRKKLSTCTFYLCR